MARGTSNTELDDLKELVRQLSNRVDVLYAQNQCDLISRLVKAKEQFEAHNADLNARLMKSQEQIKDLERKALSAVKESDKITLTAWPSTQGFARWRESALAIIVAATKQRR